MIHARTAATVAMTIMVLFAHPISTPYNNYVLLADALLHGHAWIDWPGPAIDALPYHGQRYIIEAPLPALLLLPAVALWGTATNQTLLAVVLGGLAVGTGWRLCRRFGADQWTTIALTTFLFAGTDLLFCSAFGDVWFLAHTSALCFTLLALSELTGKQRGWLVALWAICAFESRFTMIAALPVYAYWLYAHDRRALRSFALTLLPAAGLWVGYNEWRWGTIADIGYTTWYHQDVHVGEATGSPFRLRYVPEELYSFFVRPFGIAPVPPYLVPSELGTALTWTSPALILALWARRPRPLVLGLWVAVALTAIPNLLYYVNGFAQFGMRHALDFEPFLFLLMILGVAPRISAWGAVLCSYSALAGAYGTWVWTVYIRAYLDR